MIGAAARLPGTGREGGGGVASAGCLRRPRDGGTEGRRRAECNASPARRPRRRVVPRRYDNYCRRGPAQNVDGSGLARATHQSVGRPVAVPVVVIVVVSVSFVAPDALERLSKSIEKRKKIAFGSFRALSSPAGRTSDFPLAKN